MSIYQKLKNACLLCVWRYPFLAPVISQISIEESSNVPTMGITLSGRLLVNKKFFDTLNEEELIGVLIHESMHLTLMHLYRQDGRKFKEWNLATDMAINYMIKQFGEKLPDVAVYPPYSWGKKSAEEYYKLIEDNNYPTDIGSEGGLCSGCGVIDDGGDKDWEGATNIAKSLAIGSIAGDVFGELFSNHIKVNWSQLLKSTISRSLSLHGKDDQSWSRRNRRSPADIILPGWKATKSRGTVLIDTSGSVSDRDLGVAIDQVKQVANVSDSKIYLIIHDHKIQWKGWLDGRKSDVVAKKLSGRGGTCFNESYEAIKTLGVRLDYMVHMTDGVVMGWPAKPINVGRHISAVINSDHRDNFPSYTTRVDIKL